MKVRSIIAIIACLFSLAMLPIANDSSSLIVFFSPALLALIGFVTAIMAVLNKNENRKLAKLAMLINLCCVLGYLVFVIYMGFFWHL
jgi:hypothetical protein